MKKITICVLMLFSIVVKAQWTAISSGSTVKLNDVDFIDADNGVIVGDSGTVLITDNGGIYWTALNFGTADAKNVKMISPDTIIIGSIDFNNIPHVHYTELGGMIWIPMFQDSNCYRANDIAAGAHHRWLTIGSFLLSSFDLGANFDTLAQFTCGANNITEIKSTDTTYNAGGLISGFTTYSASMFRSEDNGNHFYSVDPFSFPNADALTAFDFPSTDTGYIFMNQYASFAPGSRNSLVKLYNYALTYPFPGDTEFTFTSTVIDTTFPAYINDCKMLQNGNGFAVGEDGNIYQTDNWNGGWTISYNNNGIPMNRICFPDNDNGWAVGDSGTIMKYSGTSSITEHTSNLLSVFPNPASTYITVRGITNEEYSMTGINGNIVQHGMTDNGHIDLNKIGSGCYFISVKKDQKILRSRIIVTQRN